MSDGPSSSAFLAIALIALGAAIYWIARVPAFQLVTWWAALFAVMLPAATAFVGWLGIDVPHIHDPIPVTSGEFASHPDIIILVSDAHGALSGLSKLYGFGAEGAAKRLEQVGLRVNDDMKSNYSLTHLSLPSFFEMDYPLEGGQAVSNGDRVALLGALGGRNQLTKILKANGYRFVMVEAGWSGSRCTGAVDVCIGSPWPDEAASFAIDRSIFSLWRGKFKGSLTAGTLNTVEWLKNDLPTILSNGRPDVVFAHLLIPHPPLRLGSDCAYRWKPVLGGRSVGLPGLDPSLLAQRKSAYLDQVECAQSVMLSVASLVGEDAILLVFGDHGPDSRAQLFAAPSDWSQADIEERMRVFFAAKAKSCSFEDVVSLVNVGRRLLSCLGGSGVSFLEDRYFVSTSDSLPIREVRVAG